ncbi:hypothetical protein [Levilactobacillus angrenensis]|uniref:hypothetical protein n=1 Tax=Levilactobacillus angrenensis TaxID=2486020 RepID=UPI000F77AC30|nr:hypothetical protein [Levilactobacillus angrenensis]
MYSYSSEPSWIMVKDRDDNRVWVNLKKIDYAAENNPGWTMLSLGDKRLLVKVDFNEFGKILAGGDDRD